MLFDLIIIGGGPIGISVLYRIIKLQKYNVLLIEKKEIFNNFLNMDKNMIWHSPWNGCNLKENQFNSREGNATIRELLQEFNEFMEKNIDKKFYKTNQTVYKIENIDNNYKILTKDNSYYHSKAIFIATRTNFDEPNHIPFPIVNSNIKRYLIDSNDINNKNICIIGGSWTSADAIVELQKNNKVTLLTRNYHNFKSKHAEQKNIYGHTNFVANYNPLEYRNIEKITDNQIFVDNNIIDFDVCYIFFGFSNNNNIELNCNMSKIIDNSKGAYIDLLENVYGCIKDHRNFNGRYINRPNTIDGIIQLIEDKISL